MRVYIASPYINDVEQLEKYFYKEVSIKDEIIKKSMFFGNELIKEGFLPFMPLLTYSFYKQYLKSWVSWVNYNLEWLRNCVAFLRLPEISKISNWADIEEEVAKENKISIFYSVKDLIKYRDNMKSIEGVS